METTTVRSLSPVAAAGERLEAGALLRLADVAVLLNVSSKTVRRRLAAEKFPEPVRDGCRLLRWRADDIRALLHGHGGAAE